MKTSEKLIHSILAIAATLLVIYSVDSRANPGNSAGAGRTVESGASDKINREKSISQDKSSGSKATSSSSRESAQEKSKESKASKSKKQEQAQKQDLSVKIPANNIFISEWIAFFEGGERKLDLDMKEQLASARTFFSVCLPLTGIDSTFPVLQANGSTVGKHLLGEKARVADIMGRRGWRASALEGALHPPTDEGLERGNLVSYIICRQMAHVVMSKAAEAVEMVIQDGRVKVTSEDELRRLIRKAYETVADNRDLWNMAMAFSFSTPENRVRRCAPFLGYYWDVKGHDMDCGNFRVQGDTVYINGIPTLSVEAINGRKFEIALSISDGDTQTASVDESESSKASTSRKTSASRESYSDNKKSANMKASKSSDTSQSSKTSRDSKADVQASPQQ